MMMTLINTQEICAYNMFFPKNVVGIDMKMERFNDFYLHSQLCLSTSTNGNQYFFKEILAIHL